MNDIKLLGLAGASGYLHIYGQEYWHEDAAIIGDRHGLALLRDQINRVLSGNSRIETNDDCSFFQNDGEGYSLNVVLATDEEMQSLASAYNDTSICGVWTNESSPYALIQKLTIASETNGEAA